MYATRRASRKLAASPPPPPPPRRLCNSMCSCRVVKVREILRLDFFCQTLIALFAYCLFVYTDTFKESQGMSIPHDFFATWRACCSLVTVECATQFANFKYWRISKIGFLLLKIIRTRSFVCSKNFKEWVSLILNPDEVLITSNAWQISFY